eukprot:1348088-Amorphochlora_amoeboformis.AAC.1
MSISAVRRRKSVIISSLQPATSVKRSSSKDQRPAPSFSKTIAAESLSQTFSTRRNSVHKSAEAVFRDADWGVSQPQEVYKPKKANPSQKPNRVRSKDDISQRSQSVALRRNPRSFLPGRNPPVNHVSPPESKTKSTKNPRVYIPPQRDNEVVSLRRNSVVGRRTTADIFAEGYADSPLDNASVAVAGTAAVSKAAASASPPQYSPPSSSELKPNSQPEPKPAFQSLKSSSLRGGELFKRLRVMFRKETEGENGSKEKTGNGKSKLNSSISKKSTSSKSPEEKSVLKSLISPDCTRTNLIPNFNPQNKPGWWATDVAADPIREIGD